MARAAQNSQPVETEEQGPTLNLVQAALDIEARFHELEERVAALTTAAASTKRSQIWKEIRQLRAAKMSAKSAEAKAKIRAAYRKAVADLQAARTALGSKKAKPTAKKGKKAP